MAYETLVALAFFVFLVHWYWNLWSIFTAGLPDFLKWLAIALVGALGALWGARGLQILASWNFHEAGAALWGGIFLGYLFVYIGLSIYRRQAKLPSSLLGKWLDASVPGLFLAHAIGRTGCLVAGCCYGIDGFPVMEIEIGFALSAWVALQFVWARRIPVRRPFLCSYLYGYGFLRFNLEFFRGDSGRGEFWGLTTSQWASILAILFSAIFLDFGRRTRDKTAV